MTPGGEQPVSFGERDDGKPGNWQHERAPGDLPGVPGSPQEAVAGLAAAGRAADRITPRPGRNGILAPRAQPGHRRTSVLPAETDSDGDSNSSSQRPTSAGGDSA